MHHLIRRSFFNALGTAVYISAVAMVIQHGERIFGEMKTIAGPIAFLMLFVLSAAITGSLVLGKPLLMYLDGQKREAVRLFIYTLAWLAFGMLLLLVAGILL